VNVAHWATQAGSRKSAKVCSVALRQKHNDGAKSRFDREVAGLFP